MALAFTSGWSTTGPIRSRNVRTRVAHWTNSISIPTTHLNPGKCGPMSNAISSAGAGTSEVWEETEQSNGASQVMS